MNQNPAAVVLAGGLGTRMKSDTPKHFHELLGRRMVDWVVEAARAVDERTSSIYVFAADRVWPALEQMDTSNEQGEMYLTDAVRALVENGDHVAAYVAPDPVEAEGVNTRAELAAAAAALRDRINE